MGRDSKYIQMITSAGKQRKSCMGRKIKKQTRAVYGKRRVSK